MDSVAVPFSWDYYRRASDWTAITVQGVLRTEPDGLVIEFRERPQLSSSQTSTDPSIRTLVIPWGDVQSVGVREPWVLRPRIVLRTRSMRTLDGFPEARGSEARLPVSRADRGLARELAAYVDAALADYRLRALDAPHAPPTLPPG